jgi:hypothetical protein
VIDRRRYVSIGSCASSPGGWTADGIATNPNGSTTNYTVTIYFTTSKATVEGYGTTKVEVPGGKTAKWSVRSNFTPADPHTLCVLRGVA